MYDHGSCVYVCLSCVSVCLVYISVCLFLSLTNFSSAYDPETSTMRYVGSIITVSSERPLDLVEKMNALANWPAKTPLRVRHLRVALGGTLGALFGVLFGIFMVTFEP